MKSFRADKKYKAILFDLDGVLINSYYFWFNLFNHTLEHFGKKRISLTVFRRHWGKSTKEDVKNFMPERSVKEIRTYFYKQMHRFIPYMKINPDAKYVLKKLYKQYKLGCVSNSHSKIMRRQIESSGLSKYFKIILSADDVKKPKPAPDMLLKALKKLKVQPKETIFVGDTKTDLIAGKRAKCVVVGYRIKNEFKINNLKQIFAILKKINTEEIK
ncbi:MAG: HAD family hydrolase [bacterium]